ncbi:MAG: hypothetical protein VB024_11160 [Dysgonamonadaceae bacterium]|jgi:hypothetical protein|nr:hypothetical protein [Dysgonamonadaceae bacterium]MDD3309037.1 hypothetical protein [Dysgonamonadaceae bacterium]MDD3900957.1 hypothetical protein [Dysgonamonadaceae bacterium]MDD4399378.1 hypothetical protein [Dysgonamonadaceae bacterium]MEA5082162.1 hypothetical protein [Dysgonamonadaceae bacterium]
MLINVPKDLYRSNFPTNSHFFISEEFIEVVKNKTDKVFRFMKDKDKSIGIIFGMKDNILCCPFSAPFGGFHYSHEYLSYNIIYDFIVDLKKYIIDHKLSGAYITLPPDIYQENINAKCINAFIKLGFNISGPDITNWIDLKKFNGIWKNKKVYQNLRKAYRNQLSFSIITEIELMQEAFNLIAHNRIDQGRKIHMTFEEILELKKIIPIDFFLVKDKKGEISGAGVFYQSHKSIVQAIFIADNINRRELRVIDFMYLKVFEHYKNMGFEFIDMGTSSLFGEPNIGLIRFKEIHNCNTSLRYSFFWGPNGEFSYNCCQQENK